MKTAKMIIGIISIVLTGIIMFQSLFATIGDAIDDKGGSSGGSGIVVAIIMLIAGIVSIAARKSRGGGVFCLIAYLIAGIVGVTSYGIFEDLIIWGVLCFVFAAIFLIATFTYKKPAEASK